MHSASPEARITDSSNRSVAEQREREKEREGNEREGGEKEWEGGIQISRATYQSLEGGR